MNLSKSGESKGLLPSLTILQNTLLSTFSTLLNHLHAICSEVGTPVRGPKLDLNDTRINAKYVFLLFYLLSALKGLESLSAQK